MPNEKLPEINEHDAEELIHYPQDEEQKERRSRLLPGRWTRRVQKSSARAQARRRVAEKTGFCPDVKQFKTDPSGWKGHVGDVSSVIRTALTGRKNTPDLYAIMALLGQERCAERINQTLEAIKHGK